MLNTPIIESRSPVRLLQSECEYVTPELSFGEETRDLPPYATNATVFLSGWRAKYLDEDHHIDGLATTIGNIRLERNTLKWQAAGVLSDQNFDDAYSWCYSYTVVAWNPANLNLTADHEDGSCDPNDSSDPSQANFFYDTNRETIWIDEWGYDKNTRTLRYKLSSILTDNDDYPGHYYRHKVTILGLRPVDAVSPQEKVPDLVPFSPSGNSAAAFCRFEQDRQLRVTVKNQGNADAPASETTVTFGDIPVTVNTPAIPVGGSVDLLFKVPTNCFSPDCSFKITVDANNHVNEASSEGNNSTNGGCIG